MASHWHASLQLTRNNLLQQAKSSFSSFLSHIVDRKEAVLTIITRRYLAVIELDEAGVQQL